MRGGVDEDVSGIDSKNEVSIGEDLVRRENPKYDEI